jgi:catalase-peroxidase
LDSNNQSPGLGVLTDTPGNLTNDDSNNQSPGLGVLTDTPGNLTNDFFINLLDMKWSWAKVSGDDEANYVYQATERGSGATKWKASSVVSY